MMVEIINYLFESVVCLAVFYAFYMVALHRESCFRFNRFYLITTLLLSITLPLLSIPLVFSSSSPINLSMITLPEIIIDDTTVGIRENHNSWFWMMTTYGLISSGFLIKILIDVARITIIIFTHERTKEGKYIIINASGKLPTSSFFNYIFWNDTTKLSSVEKKQILNHEKAHANEWHTFDILLLEITCAVFWFNPLVWMFKKRLVENHEYIADFKAGNEQSGYASLLAKHTLMLNGIALVHPFTSNEVINRLRMLSKTNKKTMPTKYFLALALMVFTAFGISCSVEEFTPTANLQESPSEEVFTVVEQSAMPVNGMESFYQSVAQRLTYPKLARKLGIEGRVFIQFIVDKKGNLTNFEILKGIGSGCDQAALEAVKSLPAWNPGSHNGLTVKQRIVLPITFKLDE